MGQLRRDDAHHQSTGPGLREESGPEHGKARLRHDRVRPRPDLETGRGAALGSPGAALIFATRSLVVQRRPALLSGAVVQPTVSQARSRIAPVHGVENRAFSRPAAAPERLHDVITEPWRFTMQVVKTQQRG